MSQKMDKARIYLDACALNRLFDAKDQARVRAESNAVEEILALFFEGQLDWFASEALEAEILKNPDTESRLEALKLISLSSEQAVATDATFLRAEGLERLGYGSYDALHLACAEQVQADCLLTTDDRFIRRAGRGLGNSPVKVQNPVDWMEEYTNDPPGIRIS